MRRVLFAVLAFLAAGPAWAGGSACDADVSSLSMSAIKTIADKPVSAADADHYEPPLAFPMHSPIIVDVDWKKPDSTRYQLCLRWTDASAWTAIEPSVVTQNGVATLEGDIPALDIAPILKKPLVWLANSVWLMPVTSLRVLAVDPLSGNALAYGDTHIGISVPMAAGGLALLIAVGVLLVLSRCKVGDLAKDQPLLRIITTPDGRASLSQFQLMLWTFVVGACACYVMGLRGELVDISNGTLVLLGVSAAAAVGGAMKPAADIAAVPPSWSQLILENGEISPTRVQMLLFTLISAAFVVARVGATGEIPEIPVNYQLLMGISNGIYVLPKFVTKAS